MCSVRQNDNDPCPSFIVLMKTWLADHTHHPEPSPSYWRRGLHEANGTPPLSEGRTARVSPNLDSSDGGAKRRGAVDVIRYKKSKLCAKADAAE